MGGPGTDKDGHRMMQNVTRIWISDDRDLHDKIRFCICSKTYVLHSVHTEHVHLKVNRLLDWNLTMLEHVCLKFDSV